MTPFTFQMPCLSKYDFDEYGNCYSKDSGKKMKVIRDSRTNIPRGRYTLRNDRRDKEEVSIKEIIQYGEHLNEINPIDTPGKRKEWLYNRLYPETKKTLRQERFGKIAHLGWQARWRKINFAE